MGQIQSPLPVKLIIGEFSQQISLFQIAEKILVKKFGPVDFNSQISDFDNTDYYAKEFGINLKRKFISFKKLINPSKLWHIKTITNQLEKRISKDRKRKINIDPGYITQSNLILATTKNYSHRIYMKNGIYQEITLIFKDKTFMPLSWTYPDYQAKENIDAFIKIRDILNSQLKSDAKLS